MIGAESLNTVLKCKQLYSIKNMYTDQSYKYGPLKSKSLIIMKKYKPHGHLYDFNFIFLIPIYLKNFKKCLYILKYFDD